MTVTALPICERCGRVEKPWICLGFDDQPVSGDCESCLLLRLERSSARYHELLRQGVHKGLAERRVLAELERADRADTRPTG